MANALDAFVDKLMAQAFPVLRSNCIVARNVSRTVELQAGRRGSIVDVPNVGNLLVSDVTPAPVAAATQEIETETYPVPMKYWKEVPWTLTDSDVAKVTNNILPTTTQRAVESLAGYITDTLYADTYKEVYGQVGTPGTIPFSDDTTQDARSARKLLDEQLCPTASRWAALGTDATDKATGIPNFSEVNRAGTQQTLVAGEIGVKFTISWLSENRKLPQHAAGTADTPTVNGAFAAGAKTISISVGAGSGQFNYGDIITIAGNAQQYVVADEAGVTIGASSNGNVKINPGLAVAVSGSEAVTIAGEGTSYEVQIGGHQEGVQLVSRRAADYDLGELLGGESVLGPFASQEYMREYIDPVTQLILVVILTRQHRQYRMSISCMWGVGVPQPALMFRMAGA